MAFRGLFASGGDRQQAPPPPTSTRGPARGGTGDDSEEEAQAPPTGDEKVTEITIEVLSSIHNWDQRPHKHLNFRGQAFELASLDGLVKLVKQRPGERNKIDISRLDSLDVSENALDRIVFRGMEGFASLRVLKARHNAIYEFKVVLPTLRELDISFNQLTELPPTSGMPELEVLVASHNQMTGHWKALGNLKELKKLDLSSNGFKMLPQELGERLEKMQEELPHLYTFRIKDNPFCHLMPEYPAIVLSRLPGLTKFDDVAYSKEEKDAIAKETDMDPKNLEMYNELVYAREKAQRQLKQDPGDIHSIQSQVPTFSELTNPIVEMLEDDSSENITRGVKEFKRVCDRVALLSPDKIRTIFRDLQKSQTDATGGRGEKGSAESTMIEAAIVQFLGNVSILLERLTTMQNRQSMVIRCLAKLGCVSAHSMGTQCIIKLGFLMKRNPQMEADVLEVLKEIVVEPLQHAAVLDSHNLSVVKGLAKLDSPLLPDALAPLAGWLAKIYCNSGASPQQDITHLLAIATETQQNTERALDFHHTAAANYGAGAAAPASTSGGKAESLPLHVVTALENKALMQNESAREQYNGHLKIVRNTAKHGGQRVVDIYEEKQLHRKLVDACTVFFGELPIDTSRQYTRAKANEVRKHIDTASFKILKVTTCAALLDGITALMEQSPDILHDLCDARPPAIPVVEYFSIAPRAHQTDPLLLAASLHGLHLILKDYSLKNAAQRNEMLNLIIDDLNRMSPMLDYINYDHHAYTRLWQMGEKHRSDNSRSMGLESSQAPKFTSLTNPVMHLAFEAIVNLIEFFNTESKNSKTCLAVAKAMDNADPGREQLLFRLLHVPGNQVRDAVMKCLRGTDPAEMQTEDIGQLIRLLENATDIVREDNLLRRVIDQLKRLAEDQSGQSGGGGTALRNAHAAYSVESVGAILGKNASRKTYGFQREEEDKTQLSIACVQFLQEASRWHEMRDSCMRSKRVSTLVTEVLRNEDLLHAPTNRDVLIERTWTGRSVETLLQCFAGIDSLKAQGKVAFRVLYRIADVVQGASDMPRLPEGEEKGWKEMAAVEARIWEEKVFRKELSTLDDFEMTDRMQQQLIFGNFNGLARVVQFLRSGLIADPEVRARARMREQASVDQARRFLQGVRSEASSRTDLAGSDPGDALVVRQGPPNGQNGGALVVKEAWSGNQGSAQDGKQDLLMGVLNSYKEAPRPQKPGLQISQGLDSVISRDLVISEAFFDDEQQGKVNVAYPVSAMLRACFALVKVPANEKIRKAMVKTLKDELVVNQLLSLVGLCGPLDCCVAAKFLRLMSQALTLPHNQEAEEEDRLVTFDLLMSYCGTLCRVAVRAVSQQGDARLAFHGRLLSLEIARFAAVVAKTVPLCTQGSTLTEKPQRAYLVQEVLRNLMPLHTVRSVLQVGICQNEATEDAHEKKQVAEIWDSLRLCFSSLLEQCPVIRYDVYMVFSNHLVRGLAGLKQSFLAGLLQQVKESGDRAALQDALNTDEEAIPMRPVHASAPVPGPERALLLARTEVYLYGKRIVPSIVSSPKPYLAAVVTNKALLIIDLSAGDFPDNPHIVERRDHRDITAIVRGLPSQVIYIGYLMESVHLRSGDDGYEESFITLVVHRENHRAELESILHQFSSPGDPMYRSPLQTDQWFKSELQQMGATEPHLLATFCLTVVDPSGVEELQLFVLNETQIFEFAVLFESWQPPDAIEEAGSGSEGEESENEMPGGQRRDRDERRAHHKAKDQATSTFGGEAQEDPALKELKEIREKTRAQSRRRHKSDDAQRERKFLVQNANRQLTLASLERVVFFPDVRHAKMSIQFGQGADRSGQVSEVSLTFFDDSSRETWRRVLMQQLNRVEQGGTWVKNYRGGPK